MRLYLALLMALLSASPTLRAQPELKNFVAAIVNDSVITYREVEDYTAQAVDVLYRTYSNNPQVLTKKRDEAIADGLEQLLEKQLILDDFKATGGQVPEALIEDEIRDRIRQKFGDRVTLTKTLQAQGITFETFKKRTHDEIVLNYMRQRNVASALLISPAKIERYYATNLASFKLGDQIKLRMIVLNRSTSEKQEEVKKLAQEISSKIDSGTSFAEMASIYSAGSQRQEGGDWGWVEKTVLSKGLSDMAFSLNAGQRSPLIGLARGGTNYYIYSYDKTGNISSSRKYTDRDEFVEEVKLGGNLDTASLPAPTEYYLMLVEDKRVARVRSLPEVREQIEKDLLVQERARLHKKWIDRLRAKAFVRYF